MKLTLIVGCVCPMVVVSILPHAEFGSNDHLGDARHFIFRLFWNFEIREHFKKINNLEKLERMCQSLEYHCISNPFLVKYEVIKFRKKNLPLDGKSFFFINSSRLFTSYSDVKFWNHSVFTFCTCFNNVFYCKCCQNQLFLNLNRKLDELRTNGSCLMVRWVRSGFVLMIEKRFSKVSDNGIIIWKPESRFLDEIWLHQVRGRPYS